MTDAYQTYRAYYPHQRLPDTIVGPVNAQTAAEAQLALACGIIVLQVLRDGRWVWVQ